MNIGKFIKQVDTILKKESEYKTALSNLDDNDILELIDHILTTVSKHTPNENEVIVNCDDIMLTHEIYGDYKFTKFMRSDNGSEWECEFNQPHLSNDPEIKKWVFSLDKLLAIKMFNILIKDGDVSSMLNKDAYKKINENNILNFNGFLINEKLDFPNILNRSKEIFQKESELNRLLSVLEGDDIIHVIEYILSKVSDNNRLDLDSDIIIFTNNLKGYSIDSFYNEYTDNPHWIIELVDPPYKMTPTNIELYALDTMSLVKVLNVLLINDKVSGLLNTDVFKKINEDVSAAPETRLNIFKNFNHVNKDQMGGMEIFAPRINTEINRMSDEMYDMEANDDDAIDNKGRNENGEPQDVEDGYNDDDAGLVINKKDNVTSPKRSLNYPYGMDNNPSPTFKLDDTTQSKSNIVFRFADYRGINNFR
tara:strand:+ start:15006 stop:16271 length:1266 start_codon:yes stop_codon:yes gene_type:complete